MNNLATLRNALSDLNVEQSNALENHLLGGLSVSIDSDTWQSLVASALDFAKGKA